jgi:hypothetical protein
MLDYLISWGHLYIIHFGAWVTFAFAMTFYKHGIPELKKLPSMLKAIVIIAAILSVFSSHSHHYFTNINPETKVTHAIQDK